MQRHFWLTLLSLGALASVTFLGKAYETSLRGIDSNIHASAAMGATAGGGWKPVLPIPMRNFEAASRALPKSGEAGIDPNRSFNDHPFFLFWLNGLVMRALGPDAFSARLLTAVFSVGSVLLVFSLGLALHSRAFGVVAALLAIFSRDFILTSATMSLDTALVFFILLGFLSWVKKRWWLMGVVGGIGLWMKTPLVLLVYPVALTVDFFLARRPGPEKFRVLGRLGGALLLSLAVGSWVWIYLGMNGGWEWVRDYWSRQFWGTAVGGRTGESNLGIGFFFYNVRTGFLPGLPLLIIALFRIVRSKRWKEPAFLVPAVAVGFVALVVTSMRFKLGHYYTPIFPFLALISAYSVVDWVEAHESSFYASITAAAVLASTFLVVAPVPLGPEGFVALRKFAPLIQTQGSCSDRIALVPGGEPVGSALDARLFLSFYTGRYVDIVECSELGLKLAAPGEIPRWIILSYENYERCLGSSGLSHYPMRYLMGAQVLLGSLAGRSAGPLVDLTPLELELKAVIDCKAPPYPQDLWHRHLPGFSHP